MTSGPLASIVINNFNYGRFLGAAIDSALAQSYTSVEIVVVDDGSTDGSASVIAEYTDRVISVFQENRGQGAAYNSGYRQCSGDVVCMLDADDTLFPDAIAAAVTAFCRDDVVKVQWPLVVADRAGHPTGLATVEPPPDGWLRDRLARDGPLYDFNYVTNGAYARNFLEAVLLVPEEDYRLGADEYLATLAPVYGAVVTLDHPCGTYRMHGDNNYARRALDDNRLRQYIGRFNTNAEHLAEHLRHVGTVDVDPVRWRRTAFNYLWPTRLLAVRNDIRLLIPPAVPFLLVDGGEWGETTDVDGRHGIRVVENQGQYWGAPDNDAIAIEEVRRHVAHGVRHVVIWWTCSWWQEHYPGLFRALDRTPRRIADTDGGVIYEITRTAETW